MSYLLDPNIVLIYTCRGELAKSIEKQVVSKSLIQVIWFSHFFIITFRHSRI